MTTISKNFLYCLAILLIFPALCFSQLYVGGGYYMYAKDQVLFVKQDLNLDANSDLYLRNDSQLVQGTTGLSTNSGTGRLSIFQEGTGDQYEYNYWCSPIGSATGAAGNTPFGIALLNRPTTSTASSPATILTGTYNGTANPLGISAYWIWKFVASDNYSEWIHVFNATTIQPGEGFTMKGTLGTDALQATDDGITNNSGSSQRYDFRGRPNDGNITVTVANANSTLTGNPYPSALHVNAFLLDPSNSACDGVAYYWEQDKTVNSHNLTAYRGGYGTYSPISLGSNGIYVPATFNSYTLDGSLNTVGTSSGLSIERKYAPIGQGFMILGASDGTVTLKNEHRVYYKEAGSLSQFERQNNNAVLSTNTSNEVPHIRLNMMLNNQFTRQIALALIPEATDGIDRGTDAKNLDNLPTDMYFVIEGEKYAIQGTNFDVTKRIPVGVKSSNNATVRFFIADIVNFNPNQDVFLYDAADDSYHDIKNDYYQLTLPTGTYNNRFEITFLNSALGLPENEQLGFQIIHSNNNMVLTVFNPLLIQLDSVTLYDITGKAVLSATDLESTERHELSTEGLSSGVYIAKAKGKNGLVVTQKVIISPYTN